MPVLPKSIQKRVNALRNLQLKSAQNDAEFYAAVHALECEFASQYAAVNDKRRQIVNGEVEPTDNECEWPSDDEDEGYPEGGEDETTGISSFWCTALKNVEQISHMIKMQDQRILEYLTDIRALPSASPMGFTLEFYFAPNDFFANSVLTKWYEMRADVDATDPLASDGLRVVSCQGCEIQWHPGKDVTMQGVKPLKSFFNFFKPASDPAILQADFELGLFIRDSLVPQAVLWFTGETCEEADEYQGNDGEEYGEGVGGGYRPANDPSNVANVDLNYQTDYTQHDTAPVEEDYEEEEED